MSASPDRTSNLFGALVVAAADGIREATDDAARHGAAAPAALVVLSQSQGGRSVDDLRRAVGLTPSGAVRLVDRLVEAGYAERRPGTDRRSVSVVLTPAGRRAARKVLSARAEASERILSHLTAAERASLTAIAEKLLAAHTADRLAARVQERPPAGGWLCRLCDFGVCGRALGLCPAATAASAWSDR